MTEEWIRANLPLTGDGMVLLEHSEFGGLYTIEPAILAQQFAGVEPQYDALITADAEKNLGYSKYIEKWHRAGIV